MNALVSRAPLFVVILIASCQQKDHSSIIFERGQVPSYCNPMTDKQGDELFSKFKTYISENKEIASTKSGATWRIYGPLKCGDTVSFFGKKDLQIEGGKINLEVGSHFTVNYDNVKDKFVIVGGM